MNHLFFKDMSHHIEIWLRDSFENQPEKFSNQNLNPDRPRIILARPFNIIGRKGENKIKRENKIEDEIVDYCRGFSPMPFYMEHTEKPSHKLYRVPVRENGELMEFNNGLEEVISKYVEFTERFYEERKFDVTTNMDGEGFYYPRINQHMLRLTGICDGKLWFCYDLVTGEILPGTMSLDKYRWDRTVAKFKEEHMKRFN